MKEAGIELGDVEHVAINQNSKANLWRKIAYTLFERPDFGFVMNRLKNKRERTSVREKLSTFDKNLFKGKVHEIEHHYAHLSSAFHVSPFEDAK